MRKILTTAALALLAVLTISTTASAHNVFNSADPGKESTVQTSPKQVSITFNQPVQQGPNEITVTGPDGKTRWQQSINASVSGNTVRTGLRELGPAGKYTIGYRIISADGHPVSGSSTFTLAKAGHGTPAPADSSTDPASGDGGGGVPIWVWIIVGVVVLGGGLFAALRLSNPHKS